MRDVPNDDDVTSEAFGTGVVGRVGLVHAWIGHLFLIQVSVSIAMGVFQHRNHCSDFFEVHAASGAQSVANLGRPGTRGGFRGELLWHLLNPGGARFHGGGDDDVGRSGLETETYAPSFFGIDVFSPLSYELHNLGQFLLLRHLGSKLHWSNSDNRSSSNYRRRNLRFRKLFQSQTGIELKALNKPLVWSALGRRVTTSYVSAPFCTRSDLVGRQSAQRLF